MNTDKTYAEAIASEYAPKETSKVVALKKLDRRAKLPAKAFAYTFGVCATLLLGLGMCLCLGVIGGAAPAFMALGIALGIVGIAGVSVNYLVYKRLLEKGKARYAFEITELAREIAEAA